MSEVPVDDASVREGGRVRTRAAIEALNTAARDSETGGASHTQQRTLVLEVLLDIRALLLDRAERAKAGA